MRILHIAYLGINGGENLSQKYYALLLAARNIGLDYHLVLVSVPEVIGNLTLPDADDIHLLNVPVGSSKFLLLRLIQNSVIPLELLIAELQPEHTIVRVDMMSKSLMKLAVKHQMILEYPTPPVEETLVHKPLYQALSRKYNQAAMCAAPLSLMTTEWGIGYYEPELQKNIHYFPNGISLERYCRKSTQPDHNQPYELLLMSSKYGVREYSGYDRLLRGLAEYYAQEGEWEFVLHVFGKDMEGFRSMLETEGMESLQGKVRVELHGFQPIEKINEWIPAIDLGVNDLAMFRKRGGKAHMLKTVDFLAWGLPFVMGHEDYAVSDHPELSGSYVKFDENETPVDIGKMIDFIQTVDYEETARLFRERAQELTWESVLKGLLERI